jgi:crotonobetainyl-CoA:carnitine CoA-transferase CaiB-like acyl-CoA transferase
MLLQMSESTEPKTAPTDMWVPRSSPLPLSGLRVLDFSIARAGPTAVRQLADWGAEVIRVEAIGPDEGSLTGSRDSSDFLNLHRGKRSMTLDLKQPQGQAIARELARRADVVVENFRPDVKHRLGISYDDLSAVNTRLIYGSISGFGQDGPDSSRGAVDQIIQGMSGLMSVTGAPGQGPMRAGAAVADIAAGTQLANGILLALLERQASGRGQWVTVSLLEAMISVLDFQAVRWTADGDVPVSMGNDHPTVSAMGTFATRDGYINIAAASDRLWRRFCHAIDERLLDQPSFATAELRDANRGAVNAAITAALQGLNRDDVVTRLNAAEVPCGPIYAMDEVFADRQVQHLHVTVTVPNEARGPVELLRQPVTMSRSIHCSPGPAPERGEHTDEILRDLGHDDDEISALHELGVI